MPARLGEILVREGACSERAVREALENQVIFGGRLGTNLLEIQGVAEDALARALGQQHALPAVAGDVKLSPQAISLLTPEIAERCEVVPYLLVDRRLALLVVDPRNLATLDEVSFATGKQVHPIVVAEARLWALLRRAYGVERNLRGIDVDFAWLGAPRTSVPGPAPAGAAARDARADLMPESDFRALYERRPEVARPTAPPPAARPGGAPAAPPVAPVATAAARLAPSDEVIDLTELVVEPDAAGTAPAPAASAPAAPAGATGAGRTPPARPPSAPGGSAPEPSPLSFGEAVRFLEGVDERNAIANTVLRYARSKFRRALLLTVQRGHAHGWAGLGEGLAGPAIRRMHLALGEPGVLEMVVRTRAHFLGPIPRTEANIRLLGALGGGVPANALVVPILALGRVVNLFYADDGKGGVVDSGDVGELLILATRIAKSYDTLLARVT